MRAQKKKAIQETAKKKRNFYEWYSFVELICSTFFKETHFFFSLELVASIVRSTNEKTITSKFFFFRSVLEKLKR